MCQANKIIVSYQHGVLLRQGQYGDRIYVEHDGVIIENTMPSDMKVIAIANEGAEKAVVEWAMETMTDFLYKRDYANKEIVVSFADKSGNQFAGRFNAEVKFEDVLDFIAFGRRDDLRFASNKSERDHARLVSEVQALRSLYKKAKAAEAKTDN